VTPLALGWVLLSALLHAVWSVSIKGSRDPFAFNVLQLVPPALAALALPWWFPLGELPRTVWALLAATGVIHGFYFYWLTRAFESGDLSVVYPIARSAPAFVPLVAVPLLGESVSATGALGIAVVVAGMWAVQLERGVVGWRRLAAPGAGFAWATLAATVGYSLTDKAAMARLAPLAAGAAVPPAVAFYLLLTTASGLLFVPLAWRRCAPGALGAALRHESGTALVAAAIGFVGYGLILHVLETAPVSYVVAVRQSSVLFAVVLGALRLRERPSRLRLLGALATVAGVALVALAG